MTYGELLEIERDQTPADVAAWLRAFADDLDGTGKLTVAGDGHSVTIERPAETLEFELELEREPGDDGDEIELEIELEWAVPSVADGNASDEADGAGSDESEVSESDGPEADESGESEADESGEPDADETAR